MDWTAVVGQVLLGAALVTGFASLEHKYRGVPFRRAVWREIPVVALIILWAHLMAFFYRSAHATP
ncbi:hypothetical protein U7230_15205 [Carboxydochorda subterranea]|uniref:Uncharacterized protein n=1 Tax=Carboxydichorda subterranea TaxID=3109565 RepID=A0ABZ1BXK2_9FIRM|nr:hypothetical protein [Limnochorda sp. L945t]WRP17406.1 hypothetical protein U7230_15205 [Limnochorda sp. L945t]